MSSLFSVSSWLLIIPYNSPLVLPNSWLPFINSSSSFHPLLPDLSLYVLPFIKPFLTFHKSSHCPWSIPSSKHQTLTSYITVAMPVCPRSVSCHPMGSMSFKALQAQPLPHCRSHDRSLSRETASSSAKTARRKTTGATQVGYQPHEIVMIMFFVLFPLALIFLISVLTQWWCICFGMFHNAHIH